MVESFKSNKNILCLKEREDGKVDSYFINRTNEISKYNEEKDDYVLLYFDDYDPESDECTDIISGKRVSVEQYTGNGYQDVDIFRMLDDYEFPEMQIANIDTSQRIYGINAEDLCDAAKRYYKEAREVCMVK
jgi:hypothetical protein